MGGDHFDLVVIGSGPAGEKGAAQAAYHGKRVAFVEHSPGFGGTPVATGGMPSKVLRDAEEEYHVPVVKTSPAAA